MNLVAWIRLSRFLEKILPIEKSLNERINIMRWRFFAKPVGLDLDRLARGLEEATYICNLFYFKLNYYTFKFYFVYNSWNI